MTNPQNLANRTLYVASGNQGKLRDFSTAAAAVGDGWSIEPLPGLEDIPAPDEEGETFEANARAKALYYGQHVPEALVLADDSGLSVDALDGAPGVYSARYAERMNFPLGPFDSKPVPSSAVPHDLAMTPDERNNACLLAQLSGAPAPRTAHYRCTLAVAQHGRIVATADGSVSGEILSQARGSSGFGYDPLFLLPAHELTMAQLDAATRLGLSHRGMALQNLLRALSFQVRT